MPNSQVERVLPVWKDVPKVEDNTSPTQSKITHPQLKRKEQTIQASRREVQGRNIDIINDLRNSCASPEDPTKPPPEFL